VKQILCIKLVKYWDKSLVHVRFFHNFQICKSHLRGAILCWDPQHFFSLVSLPMPHFCRNFFHVIFSVKYVWYTYNACFDFSLKPSSEAVAQWLRCCATNRTVAGSIPARVSGFFIDIYSFRSHYGPGLDSAFNRNGYQWYFLGVKAAGA